MLGVTGYSVTTASEKALDSFKAGVKAFVTLHGNCMQHLSAALEEDPDFLLAHCVLGMFWLDSLKSPSDPEVARHIAAVDKVHKEGKFNKREESYINALHLFASGDLVKATDELMAMLMEYPLDVLALRFVAGNTITLGDYERGRDTFAWVLAFWKEDMEYYSSVLAFYSFALEETSESEKAERIALRSLEMNPALAWAHHCMTHALEENHDAREGVEFLIKTREDWKDSSFGNHINWHLTLHYFDLGEIDEVFREYDANLSKNVVTENLFGLLDASSLLWRLEVSGVDVGEERWTKVHKAISEHAHNHRSPWFDTHIMMGLAYGRVTQDTARLALSQAMIKSMKEYAHTPDVFNGSMSAKLGVPVCSALLAYGEEKFDEVLQTLLPLRFDFIQFGGSWAQRQVFIVTLIEASIKANKPHITKGLLGELKARKPKSQKIQRWLQCLSN